ncbi:mannosyltransferase putative-domain-containing protein [Aspergillus varians]
MPGDDIEKFPALGPGEARWATKTRRRRSIVPRIVFFVVAVWLCYHLLLKSGEAPDEALVDEAVLSPTPETTTTITTPAHDRPAVSDKDKDNERDTEKDTEKDNNVRVLDGYPRWPSTDLERSLNRLFSTLPDESQVETILRPIETTGEAKLKELGLRTRIFRPLLEAWEAVHLVPNGDKTGLYVRDDVLQHLQRHPHIAANMGMTMTQAVHSYEYHRSIVTQLSTLLFPWTAPYFSDHMHLHAQFYGAGKGIVSLAKDDHAPFLLTWIPTIRQLGCHLPVEVFYLGDRDLTKGVRAQLEALPGVTTRDLRPMVSDRGWTLAGWAGKPFAILLSTFRQAIFIDADALFFQNPESLFADEGYRETGALFFKDRLIMPGSKRKWLQKVLPEPISEKVQESRLWTGESSHMQESGVVVVDKWRHFVTLLLVSRMNGPDRDGDKEKDIVGVYDMVFGDKETFWVGWELAGDLDYEFHGGDAGILGVLETTTTSSTSTDQSGTAIDTAGGSSTICAPQLLHLDRHGRPLWFNGWLLPNKYHKTEREPMVFESFLQEPRGQEDAPWKLHPSNICCLTADHSKDFTARERAVLEMIVANGRRVGALGKAEPEPGTGSETGSERSG